MELLMKQLEFEINEDDNISNSLAESSILMLKSIEINLGVINERADFN